jgi:hypothetical protein
MSTQRKTHRPPIDDITKRKMISLRREHHLPYAVIGDRFGYHGTYVRKICEDGGIPYDGRGTVEGRDPAALSTIPIPEMEE